MGSAKENLMAIEFAVSNREGILDEIQKAVLMCLPEFTDPSTEVQDQVDKISEMLDNAFGINKKDKVRLYNYGIDD